MRGGGLERRSTSRGPPESCASADHEAYRKEMKTFAQAQAAKLLHMQANALELGRMILPLKGIFLLI